jgi:hypothetical protein
MIEYKGFGVEEIERVRLIFNAGK